MSQAETLDHVGVVGQDLGILAEAFARLGFTLTPTAHHAGGRTGNRCIMLRHGYIELLAKIDGGTSATLDRFLARYPGIHIVAFSVADEADALARLRHAGIDAPAPSVTERLVDDADPTGPRARFALLTPPDLPEGRVHLIRHLTPEALWQDRFMAHPNHAASLEEVVLGVADAAAAAARFSRLAGRAVMPDPVGGYALTLPHGRVRIVPSEVLPQAIRGLAAPVVPFIGGLTVATDDANVTVRHVLAERGIPYRVRGGAVQAAAGGVVIRFVAGSTV